jgi:hypothetical protein
MIFRETNFLVTLVFDENADIRKQINTEHSFRNEIIKYLQHLVIGKEIKHFVVADDAVINEKLKEVPAVPLDRIKEARKEIEDRIDNYPDRNISEYEDCLAILNKLIAEVEGTKNE